MSFVPFADRKPPGVGGRGRGRGGRDEGAAGRQVKGIGRGMEDAGVKGRGKGGPGAKSSGKGMKCSIEVYVIFSHSTKVLCYPQVPVRGIAFPCDIYSGIYLFSNTFQAD